MLVIWIAIVLPCLLLATFILISLFAVNSARTLKQYDQEAGLRFPAREPDNKELMEAHKRLASTPKVDIKTQLPVLRDYLDNLFPCDTSGFQITPVNAGGVSGEWVLAPGVDSSKRLLYLHGGAFMMGSARSHRVITTRLSEQANAAVLAIDYRLLPEHKRLDSLADCKTAYQWMLKNGPEGQNTASTTFIAGDSAGGNLTLALSAWARDSGIPSPNAVAALSPLTDSLCTSPSLANNLETDLMLKRMISMLLKFPLWLLFLVNWITFRCWPKDPRVSPLYGNLAGLPPTLIQVSEQECLFDDCRRYVNKAQSSGSLAILQTWRHVPHVWQMFAPDLPEANQAIDEIGSFLRKYS